jgi:hypothetical protein
MIQNDFLWKKWARVTTLPGNVFVYSSYLIKQKVPTCGQKDEESFFLSFLSLYAQI